MIRVTDKGPVVPEDGILQIVEPVTGFNKSDSNRPAAGVYYTFKGKLINLITSLFPKLQAGKYLTNDGNKLSWATIALTAVWGDITGNISDQVDLQSVLNEKASEEALNEHINDFENPHSVTKDQVGLSNVPNEDATDPNNINQDEDHRFVTDSEKSTWDGKQNAITTGTADEYFKGNLSLGTFDTDVKATIKEWVFSQDTNTYSVTSTTSDTILKSILIPANTFGSADKIDLRAFFAKNNGSTCTYRIYHNTTNSLVGATVIGNYNTSSGGATVQTIPLQRSVYGKGAGSQLVVSSSTSLVTDLVFTAAAPSTLSIDFTQPFYLIFAAQPAATSVIAYLYSVTITITR